MATTSISITHGRASDLQYSSGLPARLVASKAADLLTGAASGTRAGGTALEVAQTCASGTVTFSGSDGDVTITINGVDVTENVDSQTDAQAAAALAAAIEVTAESTPIIDNHVTVSVSGAVVTITAKHPGHPGNAITLAASGTGVTASGARLTGGTSTTYTF